MSEGPQVLIRTEWLRRWLVGQTVVMASTRDTLAGEANANSGSRIDRVDCVGKHIFLRFTSGCVLHNHLLMKGRWRKYPGGMLIPPGDAWIQIDRGDSVICNLRGQMLEWMSEDEARQVIASLGPDALKQPYPLDQIERNLIRSTLPITEALLDQALLSGIGNTARSEILFTAQLDPRKQSCDLTPGEMERLHEQIVDILWESYRSGGRWRHRVYRRNGEPCVECGAPIEMIRLAPTRRSTYYCPSCQTEPLPSLF